MLLERLKSLFVGGVRSIKAFFINGVRSILNFFDNPIILTEQDKYDVVMYLLKGQKDGKGFALRHVSTNNTKKHNVNSSFDGDAISAAITNHLMSSVLNTNVTAFSWYQLPTGQMSLYYNDQSRIMDRAFAARLFDCWHGLILQFIEIHFATDTPHFMLIKNMDGATTPYDIGPSYPTGKCGKREIDAAQIIKVFSKKSQWETAEELLKRIEIGILQVQRPKHAYSKESTDAILKVLRAIELRADEERLAMDNVRSRLTAAEYENRWSEYTYQQFYQKEKAFVPVFTKHFSDINDDLDYFRAEL